MAPSIPPLSQTKIEALPNRTHHSIGQSKGRVINSMNLNPTNPAVVVKPYEDRKQLMKSDGPILNYIFNSQANSQLYSKHHHHDLR
jgi:hypothetical protein